MFSQFAAVPLNLYPTDSATTVMLCLAAMLHVLLLLGLLDVASMAGCIHGQLGFIFCDLAF